MACCSCVLALTQIKMWMLVVIRQGTCTWDIHWNCNLGIQKVARIEPKMFICLGLWMVKISLYFKWYTLKIHTLKSLPSVPQIVNSFGDKVFTEVIRLKWVFRVGPNPKSGVPLIKLHPFLKSNLGKFHITGLSVLLYPYQDTDLSIGELSSCIFSSFVSLLFLQLNPSIVSSPSYNCREWRSL